MNYRHGYHAGNFATTYSSTRSSRACSIYLARKDAPMRFIDTHAGGGRYDLSSEAARRSPEWRDGVARLVEGETAGRRVADLLALLYIRAIRPFDEAQAAVPLSYPGSPALAQGAAAAAGSGSRSAGASTRSASAWSAALERDIRLQHRRARTAMSRSTPTCRRRSDAGSC